VFFNRLISPAQRSLPIKCNFSGFGFGWEKLEEYFTLRGKRSRYVSRRATGQRWSTMPSFRRGGCYWALDAGICCSPVTDLFRSSCTWVSDWAIELLIEPCASTCEFANSLGRLSALMDLYTSWSVRLSSLYLILSHSSILYITLYPLYLLWDTLVTLSKYIHVWSSFEGFIETNLIVQSKFNLDFWSVSYSIFPFV
jgi:hypothetical protein